MFASPRSEADSAITGVRPSSVSTRGRRADGHGGGVSEQFVEVVFAERAFELDHRGRAGEGHCRDLVALDGGATFADVE